MSSCSGDDFVVLSLLKERGKRKEILGPSNPEKYCREEGEFPLLIKEQRVYHGRFKVYFRMSLARFDALLTILKSHIKKKTISTISVNSVCKDIYIALCCETKDELDNHHSGFWRSLVQWL